MVHSTPNSGEGSRTNEPNPQIVEAEHGFPDRGDVEEVFTVPGPDGTRILVLYKEGSEGREYAWNLLNVDPGSPLVTNDQIVMGHLPYQMSNLHVGGQKPSLLCHDLRTFYQFDFLRGVFTEVPVNRTASEKPEIYFAKWSRLGDVCCHLRSINGICHAQLNFPLPISDPYFLPLRSYAGMDFAGKDRFWVVGDNRRKGDRTEHNGRIQVVSLRLPFNGVSYECFNEMIVKVIGDDEQGLLYTLFEGGLLRIHAVTSHESVARVTGIRNFKPQVTQVAELRLPGLVRDVDVSGGKILVVRNTRENDEVIIYNVEDIIAQGVGAPPLRWRPPSVPLRPFSRGRLMPTELGLYAAIWSPPDLWSNTKGDNFQMIRIGE